ncbi:hypothetical protein MMC11_004286 [Xylographa trunciseda]|nr:hypothetical protein [Xylographa trunciseda]
MAPFVNTPASKGGNSSQVQHLDILIIGGGPGGLSAALTLARQLHTAVVFNHGIFRNTTSNHMHNVLTWDNADPKDFLKAGRDNILANYQTIQFRDEEVVRVRKNKNGLFEAEDKGGQSWTGKKLILAMGVEDVMSDIPGYKECWDQKSIFHCFFCHGYEARGSSTAGVLAVDGLIGIPQVLHFARNAQRFSDVVTIYTNGSGQLRDGLLAELGGTSKYRVDARRIKRLVKGEKESEVIVQLEDGSEQVEAFLGHKPKNRLRGPFAQQLGLEIAPSGDPIATPPFFMSSLTGCFICGDLSSPLKIVPNAMLSGAAAGAGACAQLQAEEMGQESMVSVTAKTLR